LHSPQHKRLDEHDWNELIYVETHTAKLTQQLSVLPAANRGEQINPSAPIPSLIAPMRSDHIWYKRRTEPLSVFSPRLIQRSHSLYVCETSEERALYHIWSNRIGSDFDAPEEICAADLCISEIAGSRIRSWHISIRAHASG
ncbi:MAG: hypothetical protein ACRD3W_32135, partial [Terriglobales bacterium]